jgi:hypothetical protein
MTCSIQPLSSIGLRQDVLVLLYVRVAQLKLGICRHNCSDALNAYFQLHCPVAFGTRLGMHWGNLGPSVLRCVRRTISIARHKSCFSFLSIEFPILMTVPVVSFSTTPVNATTCIKTVQPSFSTDINTHRYYHRHYETHYGRRMWTVERMHT